VRWIGISPQGGGVCTGCGHGTPKNHFRYPLPIIPDPPLRPTLFNGDKVTLYGTFKPKSKGKSGQQLELAGIAILKGCTLDQPLEYTIPFQILKHDTEQLGGDSTLLIIHQLAAKSLSKIGRVGRDSKGFLQTR